MIADLGLEIRTVKQFEKHIEQVINNGISKSLIRNRTAYWDDASGTVVIHNPNAMDGGTAFQPIEGKAYYDKLQ